MSQIDALHSLDPFWILRVIYEFFVGGAEGSTSFAANAHLAIVNFFHNLPFFAINAFATFAVFSFFLSIALFILVIIYVKKLSAIRKKIVDKVLPVIGAKAESTEGLKMINKKWELVQKHMVSNNPSDWKLAILEADIMLSELLESMALPGESIGERLQAVEKGDFDSIEDAWEAHKIRNAIAHEGSDFMITEREAKRVVGLYERVFSEFEVI